jgi:tetratricopeptide (TPR) repeat protein
MLIVLDNARTSDQVLPLLPDAPGCLVLITSRRKLTGLTDAYPLSLDVLGWDEAERLFVKLVGEQRCQDRDAVRQVLAACGRLPLAIRLIAGRLRHHRGELLAEVAAELADQTAALDALMAEHLSVRAAFEWSYQLLLDEQRRAFRLLSWHPGPEITPVVLAALADVSPTQGKQLLRDLADHNVLDQLSVMRAPGGPRYRMHDLVWLYAGECADAEEPPTQRAVAVHRLGSSYLAIAREADRLLWSYVLRPYARDLDEGTASKSVLALADASQARSWLTMERPNLLECVKAMSANAEAAELATVLAVHFRAFGFWSDVRDLYSHALSGYRHLGDRRGEVGALWGLGEVECFVGEHDQAREYYTQALTLARHLGDRRGEVNALGGLGGLEWISGEYGQAREDHTQALILARELGDQRAEADALVALGHVERRLGNYGHAREYHTQALTLAQQLGYRFAEAGALLGLGDVERLIGKYGQARDYHPQVLTLARQLGDPCGEAAALQVLGMAERFLGEYAQSREYQAQALALARQLGHRRGEVLALRELGEVERSVGEYGQARDYYTQALTLARQVGYRFGEVVALLGLGKVEGFVGESGQSREYHTQALALARRLGYRRGEAEALRGLGEVERLVGQYGKARDYYTRALDITLQLGERPCEAEALWGLGHVASDTGERDQACEFWRKALDLYDGLGVPFTETVRAAMHQLDC